MERRTFLKIGAGTAGAMLVPVFGHAIAAEEMLTTMPVAAKKALAEMTSGQILRVQATDPGSVRDFQAFARQTGNILVGQSEENKEFTFYMKRK